MTGPISHGSPLLEVSSRLGKNAHRVAILLIIDGCRADALYDALGNGGMPKLKGFMDEVGYAQYDNCFTVFPSVTITCHSSIVTGTYPGAHGIVGNEWFIRKRWGVAPDSDKEKRDQFYKATREYVKYSWRHPLSDPGLANGLFTGTFFGIANSDLYHSVKTLYEEYSLSSEGDPSSERSMSIFEMITRGADEAKYIDLDDVRGVGGRIVDAFNWMKSKVTKKLYLSFSNNGLDCRAFDELLDVLGEREDERPKVFVVWLPGMDGFSHLNGAIKQPEYFRPRGRLMECFVGDIDDKFDKLRQKLQKANLLDDALIIITADHGQYDCSKKLGISNEMLYHCLKFDPVASKDEAFPLTEYGEIDNQCKDASVVVVGNGGACYIYVKSDEGWGSAPSVQRMEKFLNPLARFMAADKVFVRYSDKEYRWWDGGEYQRIESLDPHEYPLAAERVNNLAATLRSGDIILTVKSPFYYATGSLRGEHGSLHREDSHVPLLFINADLEKARISRDVRTIDISPTVAESMGFLKELTEGGTDKDKLLAILDALEKLLSSKLYKKGLERTVRRIDRFIGEKDKIREEWKVEELDMRNNFEQKVKNYRITDRINADDFDELVAKYEGIKRMSKFEDLTFDGGL